MSSEHPPSSPSLTPLQLLLFPLIPVVALALAGEAYLRVTERPGPSSLLTETHEGVVVPKDVEEGPHLIQGLNPQVYFPAPGPDGPPGVDIILLGGSSTYGFPYQPHSSIAQFMARRLEDALPDRPVNVVNLGYVSADSFMVTELGREALDHRPDAIVIYAGHNEYLHFEFSQYDHYRQAPEPASPLWPKGLVWWASEGSHLLRWGRFLLTDVKQGMVAKAAAKEGRPPSSLYDRRAEVYGSGEGAVPQELARVESTFRRRLGAFIAEADDAGVPVILASPLADYISFAPSGFPEEDGGPTTRSQATYRDGQRLMDDGDLEGAARAFVAANDEDPFPHRIKSWGRQALLDLAETPGAYYAPVWETLGAGHPGGLPPMALTVDHVHPSLPGQDAIAKVLIDSLMQAGVLPDEAKAALGPSTQALMAELELSPAKEWVWNQRLAHYLAHSGDRGPATAILEDTLARGGVDDSPMVAAYAESIILGALGEEALQKRHDAESIADFGEPWHSLSNSFPALDAAPPKAP